MVEEFTKEKFNKSFDKGNFFEDSSNWKKGRYV